MEIVNHRFVGPNVQPFVPTPKTSGKYATGDPDTIIIHYTATDGPTSAVNTLKDPNIKASATMVVGTKGEVIQMSDLNVITWHAGVSAFKLPTDPTRNTFNKHSIGIEIVNPGYLKKVGNEYKNVYNKTIPAEMVFEGKHRNPITKDTLWHKYPKEQIDVVYEICRLLIKTYPSIKYILGHEEICPGRKTDPGPAFPLDDLRKTMGVWIPGTEATPPAPTTTKLTGWVSSDFVTLDNSDDDFDAIVSSDVLNIRSSPEVKPDNKIASPLKKGDKLQILEQQSGWYKVVAERI